MLQSPFLFVLGEQSINGARKERGRSLSSMEEKIVLEQIVLQAKVVFDKQNRMFNVDFDEVLLNVVHRR